MFGKLFGNSQSTGSSNELADVPPQPSASSSALSSDAAEAAAAEQARQHELDRPRRTLAEELALQDALYPDAKDVPTCMQLFDVKMRCLMTFKEQGRSIYRTGSINTCEDVSNDFTWCWQTLSKIVEPERKREAWVRRRAEWWTGRRLGESSEDVWDARGADRLRGFPPRLTEVDELKEDMTVPRPDNRLSPC